jgi:hypothetical protein
MNAQPTGSAAFNSTATLASNTIQFYAGPRSDPFFFDLFAFFTFAGDRNYGVHTSQTDPGPAPGSPNAPAIPYNGDSAANIAPLTPAYDKSQPAAMASFNGFAAGTTSNGAPGNGNGGALGSYACSTNPASDTLDLGPFNVLSYVVEVPKSLITNFGNYNTGVIHVWATVSSHTTNS